MDKLKDSVTDVTFTIGQVTSGPAVYQPGDNHDPDSDSDGTTIAIAQP
jgi:hypothetical protein